MFARLSIFAVALIAFTSLHAQVPQLINYQGRVAVAGVNFDGSGQFKFALVNASGSTTFWSNDGTSSAGSRPTNAVALTVSKGLYSVLLGDAALVNMTAIPASVFNNSDVRLRVWFNDGTNGSQLLTPDQRIAAVGYAIMAGNVSDGAITTSKIAAGAVTSTQLAAGSVGATQLGTGAVGASQLAPGAAVANLNAGGQSGVASGGVVLSTNANATALVNAGYVKLTGIETAERYQPLHNAPPPDRYTHTAVWTGSEMIVWGGVNSNGTYLNDGARYNPAFDLWTPISTKNAPSERAGHSGVSVAGIMIVWGGTNATTPFADGGYYNPASDEWTPIPVTAQSPSARAYHTAVVSSANEVIIWGGLGAGNVPVNTGGRLYFTQWQGATSTTNAPAARYVHRAVWTGTEMIVWGGALNGSSFYNDGAHYNPTNNTWTAMSASPLATRYAHVMVWTGTRVLIWGGLGSTYYDNGASYEPTAKAWILLNSANAPSPRFYSTAVWTGSDMIVFGGQGSANTPLNDGASYSTTTNSWTPLPVANSPTGRYVHTSVWTGSEMIVWGGYGRFPGNTTATLSDGARYSPDLGSWRPLAGPRGGATAVWTGAELLIWGGSYGNAVYPDGLRLDMATNTWRRIALNPAVTPQYGQTAVWTGSEMIIWGGLFTTYTPFATNTYLNTGGRYDPASDSWTPTKASTAPAARSGHSAVWTGSEMIVWGGYGDSAQYFGNGGRYRPSNDSWTALPDDPAISARSSHKAVWTGSKMLIWGGANGSILGAGARFDPVSGTWTAMSTAGEPLPRIFFSAVWSGTELLIWGGQVAGTFDYVNDGGRYNPASNTWTGIPATPLVNRRGTHGAVWSGSEMIIWGGRSTAGGNSLADGGRFDPAAGGGVGKWSAIAPSATIGDRSDSVESVWTGSEMLLFTPYASTRGSFADVFSYTPPKTLYLYVRP
ncbi:MAG: kelch repeat-containing protein [Chthoniobacteraceae bacterium]